MAATEYQIESVAKRAAELFAHRTDLVREGGGDLNDILPETRVTWHEVASWIDAEVGPQDRIAFQRRYEAELKKRGLLSELKGKPAR